MGAINAWHFVDGKWVTGDPLLMTAWSHATWLGAAIFDGALAMQFEIRRHALEGPGAVENRRAQPGGVGPRRHQKRVARDPAPVDEVPCVDGAHDFLAAS